MFPSTDDINLINSTHVETVALLSRQKVDEHIYFNVNVGDLPKTARTTATYPEIKAYVKDKYGLNVTSLNIAQVKENTVLRKGKTTTRAKRDTEFQTAHQKKRKQSKMLLSTLECSKLAQNRF